MRILSYSTLALLPAALIAQAPANISQQLKAEQPAIDGLIKSFKAKEALVKAEALIATPAPAYDKKDLNTIVQSSHQVRDLVSAHMIAAKAANAAGQWERANAILEKGLAIAKQNKADFLAATEANLDATWKKPETDAKAFLAGANERAEKIKTLESRIASVELELSNAEAIKKMNKTERAALKERQAQAVKDADEIGQLKAMENDRKMHEDNLAKVAQVRGYLDEMTKDADGVITAMAGSLEKNQARVMAQADEIKVYNSKQAEQKKGKKKVAPVSWVEAVMNDTQNVVKLAPADEVSFLNRLLVVEPSNKKAQKALDNVIAGKAPFEAEKKAAKGKKR